MKLVKDRELPGAECGVLEYELILRFYSLLSKPKIFRHSLSIHAVRTKTDCTIGQACSYPHVTFVVSFPTKAGQPNSCIDDDPAAHRNIGVQKKLGWTRAKGFRDWRSILSIPIVDSEYWVPVAVVSITSNYGIPFWNRFGEEHEKYEQELQRIVRGAAHEYLLKKDPPGAVEISRSAVKRRGEK